MKKITTRGLLFLGFCVLGACQTTKIVPGTTQVEDTPQKREVLARMEEYRKALLEQAYDKVFAMAHPSYQSTRGTTDPRDDYPYLGLKDNLSERIPRYLAKITAFTIRFDDIIFQKVYPAYNQPVEQAVVLFGYKLHFTLTYEVKVRKKKDGSAQAQPRPLLEQKASALSTDGTASGEEREFETIPITQNRAVEVTQKKAVLQKKDGIWFFVEGL